MLTLATGEDKAELFRRLTLTGNGWKVASELGLVRITSHKWTHPAGIFTSTDTSAKRARFPQLRDVSRAGAATLIGIDKSSEQDWVKCITQIARRRAHSERRVVRFLQPAMLANVKTPSTT